MNLLNIEHVSKIFGDKVIFDDVSLGIHNGDKIGIVGMNGTGKTTLLKIIAGMEDPDSGQVICQNGIRIEYLPQHPQFPEDMDILAYMTAGRPELDWSAQSDAKTALNRLGITEHQEKVGHLSGGQKKKVALARILTADFDVLMLDEPTNHLDYEMLAWLEDYLCRFKGVVIMVTHDRYFLDRVSNQIVEISHGNLYSYNANYSGFLELKVQREEMEQASQRKRQSVLRMELEWAKRGCRARSTKQRARLERLEQLQNGMVLSAEQGAEIDSVETRMGKKTLELQHISKRYGDKVLLEDFNYIVLKNQRLGLIGPNGCGKSTLLKIMAGLLEPDSGRIEVGETVRMGYFSQDVPDMDSDRRVIDYVKDIAEYVPTREGRITASQMLERFLFTPDMQYTPVNRLSGGEKKRLYLLSVLIDSPNFLALDEISNDLDIPTLTILEDYLNSFSGIVVTVSHDRYFLDNVVDRIFAFSGNGKLLPYDGGYTEYLATVRTTGEKQSKACLGSAPANPQQKKTGTRDWKQNQPVKLKFSYKEQQEFETIDADIEELEQAITACEADMLKHATNSSKLSELLAQKEEVQDALEEKMERWVYLNDLAERIDAAKEKTGIS